MAKTAASISGKQIKWVGERSRPLQACRPCECGCDAREGLKGVGYITGSDAYGNGFTVWIEDEVVFSVIHAVIGGGRELRHARQRRG